jgi:lipid-binding SYLF domain-containing protein
MASLWQRWSQDASHALQDIYGNMVLGDDTGESSRLVLVVQPPSTASATSSRNAGSSRRQSHSHSHSYTHTMNHHHHHHHPHTTTTPTSSSHSMLGFGFCEINGRAYVQSVEPGSRAEMEGILPKDCVHYAAVLAKEWKDPLHEPDHAEIKKRALDREMTGQRISYLELKRLLQSGTTSTTPMDGTNTATATNNAAHNATTTTATSAAACLSPSVPTTIQVGGGTNPCGPMRSANSSPTLLLPPGAEPRPLVLVFRRTKQRPSTAFLPIWPNFRLDDECDEACRILKSLAQDDNHNNDNDNGNNDGEEEENVEAATIRGMIQKAVGLAFLRTNKVVLGVSLHAGSGLVLARLPDGTWSAPSAIGIAGVGLGLQLGVEVAHSIIVLQTKEALEHFQRGGSFTVGANVGAAVGALGREAVGAASVSGALCGGAAHVVDIVKDDEYHADTYTHEPPSYPFSYSSYLAGATATKSACSSPSSSVGVAPLVAYAKSQGLYVGVSLEGSRISGRNQVNARAYQFDTHKAVSAHDLLTGKVAPPPEAEGLYAALHEVEFTHELKSLPRPPKSLRTTMGQPWNASGTTPFLPSSSTPLPSSSPSPSLELKECAEFNQSVRQFLYGGVYVWRVRGRKRERRTLWLYVPEAGAPLRLGFVSKLSNLETTTNSSQKGRTSSSDQQQDHRSVTSEELTLDSALVVRLLVS